MFVSWFEVIPASKSGSEHKDGRFWRMEVSDETIDGLELEAGINENVVFAFGFAGFSPVL